ncbi:Ribosomal RNA small subunit methyltransferase I [Marinomonas aquimarina]|uniref:Ribosomal RNA small subunit methyltransferase I n=1 Tax=Marinomonas aquimarina TaxID=295068 RepID=A0A1A8T7D2_9GAMM|nr:16S rRNA (cytidine(1402)-2'-O)-methyltransferase [Marinomonas aquimarina]SBS27297.1 Ribosomal RNA small subunit methyltransferase I [Marinomonas aquimarina]
MVTQSDNDVRGTFYIVATPIGNLDDFTDRAKRVLQEVDFIAAEDTRHSKRLMNHFGIDTKLFALHDHNERDKASYIASLLNDGKNVALISDAGTPLISDPGYHVVNFLRQEGHKVVPVPGPSALITALCASGLPTDRFSFVGFLPAKSKSRRDEMSSWVPSLGTVVFYESTHRILDCLADLEAVWGESVQVALAREITKTFETFLNGSVAEIQRILTEDSNQTRGEFVMMVSLPAAEEDNSEALKILKILLKELPVKQAAALAAEITGEKKNALYKQALAMNEE